MSYATAQRRGPAGRTSPLPGTIALGAVVLVAIALVVASCSMVSNSNPAIPTPTSMPAPPEVGIAYGPDKGCAGPTQDQCGGSQTLDIYRARGVTPETRTKGEPRKVAVWVHGGGFVAGDKTGSLSQYFSKLLDDGWDIVALNYRLTMGTKNAFPTAVMDVKRAVRWVKANAAGNGWDPEKVAAIGHSAGGNLVGMLATTADDPSLEDPDLPPELRAVDSSITSAVTLSAVSDMAAFSNSPTFADAVKAYVSCAGQCDRQLAQASVQTHVDARSSPILAFHGARDLLAAPAQGRLLETAYKDAGIADRFKLIIVDDGPVEFQGHVPDIKRWIGDIGDWLDGHLQ